MDFSFINYPAAVVAAVASFVLGFLWHGPLFGKVWLRLSGITDAQVQEAKAKGGMGKYMAAAFVQQLVVAFVVAWFAHYLAVTDVIGAALFAGMAWLGFIAMTLLNGVLWEKRTVPLYLFNVAYHLVSLFVMTLIIALWR